MTLYIVSFFILNTPCGHERNPGNNDFDGYYLNLNFSNIYTVGCFMVGRTTLVFALLQVMTISYLGLR